MLTLGLETSLIPGSIALCDDGICLEERTLQTDRRHAETLIPEIQGLLAEHGYHLRDCQAVAVSEGPGSFTGLRIGVTCAKTLAYATGAKLAAIPTLTSVAHNVVDDVQRLFVVSDAQRKQLFCAEFGRDDNGIWEQVTAITIVDADEFASQRNPHDHVTGPGVIKFAELFRDRCTILPPATWMPHAAVIAQIGEQEIRAERTADIWGLQPFYLRKSAAEERWAG
ncbi:tRNA threonylcarbamoyladenosine biosynthesis protein TsaB [Symmachiella macrocystis]|uniref:tRNA threonylcarbamoyladenosine biosynthesis protein TsaB n=1 Tax=Symmachiella macrocystis TaxID=2527985 RepID=A0A5C6B4I9_9PLAN|nr:tRNA (adenosine(37)-N6)-threonylcarbamoyltransferase complex dimerization subunit type 1 TsaB [Symmachiella macrocystis]TWU06840.1 tRNA threonylcarbamoyladenosine biosynthesis protein TsaB [Symmachiella macrocystis]